MEKKGKAGAKRRKPREEWRWGRIPRLRIPGGGAHRAEEGYSPAQAGKGAEAGKGVDGGCKVVLARGGSGGQAHTQIHPGGSQLTCTSRLVLPSPPVIRFFMAGPSQRAVSLLPGAEGRLAMLLSRATSSVKFWNKRLCSDMVRTDTRLHERGRMSSGGANGRHSNKAHTLSK